MHKIYSKKVKSAYLQEINDELSDITGCWLNVIAPDRKDVDLICRLTKLNEEDVQSLLDEYERPRIEKKNELVTIVFHTPLSVHEDLETTPLIIFMTPSNIITVCGYESPIINDFVNYHFKNFTTTMKSRFILLLLSKINIYFERYLRKIDGILENLEKNLSKYTDNREIHKIFRIKKSLIYFHTAVIANGKVLRKITMGSAIPLYESDRELLEDIIIDNEQTIEIVSIYNNIITSSLDAYTSVVSNNMNVVMKSLTIVTITLSIPTVLASMWGMNVAVPLQGNPYAFAIVITISIAISIIVSLLFFREKRSYS
jgi:magnesium transporter